MIPVHRTEPVLVGSSYCHGSHLSMWLMTGWFVTEWGLVGNSCWKKLELVTGSQSGMMGNSCWNYWSWSLALSQGWWEIHVKWLELVAGSQPCIVGNSCWNGCSLNPSALFVPSRWRARCLGRTSMLIGLGSTWWRCYYCVIDRFYIALFSPLQQTHCTFVTGDSEWVTVAFL